VDIKGENNMGIKVMIVIMHLISGSMASVMFFQQTKKLKSTTLSSMCIGMVLSLIQTTFILFAIHNKKEKAYR
jgi:phosphatidylserine synthase